MIDVFTSLKALIRPEEVRIDNFVFRLHYKATVILLLACSILVTSFQYFGDPIECEAGNGVKEKVMNLYCWMKSTFIIIDYNENGLYSSGLGNSVDSQTVYQQYYQWVFIILFLQAVIMYFPAYLWKQWENKLVASLCCHLDKPVLENSKEIKERKAVVVQHLSENIGNNQNFVRRYIFCELLNFTIVLAQMFWMDFFLNNAFFIYGVNILGPNAAKGWSKTVARTFPKLTKCHFYKYGSSGSLNLHDGLCILPLNMLNEKIYIVLWIWYVFLIALSFVQIIIRAIEMFSNCGRLILLKWKLSSLNDRYVKILCKNLYYGDLFLLSLMSKNLNSKVFVEIVKNLCDNYLSNCEFEMRLRDIIDLTD